MIEIATKEGWREYVDTIYERPAPITAEHLRALSFGDRAMYNQGRAQYSQAGAFVQTPQFQAFQSAVRDRVMLNAYRRVGKLGLILSGGLARVRPPRSSRSGAPMSVGGGTPRTRQQGTGRSPLCTLQCQRSAQRRH